MLLQRLIRYYVTFQLGFLAAMSSSRSDVVTLCVRPFVRLFVRNLILSFFPNDGINHYKYILGNKHIFWLVVFKTDYFVDRPMWHLQVKSTMKAVLPLICPLLSWINKKLLTEPQTQLNIIQIIVMIGWRITDSLSTLLLLYI